MLSLKHKGCGGNIHINIDIQNVFGKPNIKIKDKHKILISFASLIARNVKIKTLGLSCDNCQEVLEGGEELELRCGHSGNKGGVEDFRIIYAFKETGEELNPQLLHISVKDDYIKDVKNDGFTVQEVEPKIYLDEEIKNG